MTEPATPAQLDQFRSRLLSLIEALLEMPDDLTDKDPIDYAGTAISVIGMFTAVRRGLGTVEVLRYTLAEYEAGLFAGQLDAWGDNDEPTKGRQP